MEPITGTNKSVLIKDIRHIAEANRLPEMNVVGPCSSKRVTTI